MIVANRSLTLRNGQTEIEVAVRIFAPEHDRTAWVTKYEIDWPEGMRRGAAEGFDPVQSLLHALTMIGAEIYTSDYHKSGNLTWGGPGQGYGFPVPQNLRALLIGDDAKFL